MKKLIMIALCFLCWMNGRSQQYTISADTVTCRVEVTNPASAMVHMFLVDEVRYVDVNEEIQIFDDRTTIRLFNSVIVSHASIAALKTDIDAWITACRP